MQAVLASQSSKASLLKYLHRHGDSPRVDIAKALSITKPAITKLTNELIAQGILIEKGERPLDGGAEVVASVAKRGRRKILVGINKNYRLLFGIAVLKDGICAGLSNLDGEILQRASFFHKKPAQEQAQAQAQAQAQTGHIALLELAVEAFEYLLKENCLTPERLLGLGVCIGGDCSGICEGATIAEQLVKLKRDLSHAIRLPIVTLELAAGALLAEHFFNKAANNFKSGLMLAGGASVIQTAVYLNGGIYRGANGGAGGLSLLRTAENPEFDTSRILSNEPLISKLAEKLFMAAMALDVEKIFGFGGAFEDESFLEKLNSELLKLETAQLLKTQKPRYHIEPAYTGIDACFLCGCAAAEQLLFPVAAVI